MIDPWNGIDTGDYPTKLCKECFEKLEKYRPEAEKIRFESDIKIDKLYLKWYKECLREEADEI